MKSIYATVPFADQFNCANDSYDAQYKGSAKVFDNYIRIVATNTERVFPVTFSTYKEQGLTIYPDDYYNVENWGVGDDGDWSNLKYPDESLTYIKAYQRISLYAVSQEFDLYCKTLYQYGETLYSLNNDPEFSILLRRNSVYSNVKGGVGIFAAFNARCNEIFDFTK